MNIIIYVPKWGTFLRVSEGTGDNLTEEDIEEGYKDYYMWYEYRMTDDGDLLEEDGGMGLCEELLMDTCKNAEDMLHICLAGWFAPLNRDEYIIIKTK